MAYLATLAQVESELSNKSITLTAADKLIVLDRIETCSDRIQNHKHTYFEPIKEVRYFDARGDHITQDGKTLMLKGCPLLEVTSITLGDGTTLSSNQYTFTPRGNTPYRTITINQDVSATWRTRDSSGNWVQATAINATWGYRKNYAAAYVAPSGLAINDADGINTTDATITVDSNSILSPGMLIKIDSELMRVLTVPSATSITVTRAVNGTTAAAHDDNDVISYWTPEPVVAKACYRWVGLLVSRRGSYEQSKIDQTGTIISYPADMPGDVAGDLNSLFNVGIWGVVG